MGKGKSSKSQMIPYTGLVVTTLTFSVSYFDPFNLPKMLVLAPFAFIALYSALTILLERKIDKSDTFFLILLLIFLLSQLWSFLNNKVGIWQFIMGTYQRNLGFLTFALFVMYSIWAALSLKEKDGLSFLFLLVTVGGVEVFYGLIQNSGNDFISWNNPYSPIIGTFGNPNYMSAFMGLSSGAALILLLAMPSLTFGLKLVISGISILGLYLCVISSSIQGVFVFLTAITSFIAMVLWKRKRFISFLAFVSLLSLGFVVSILGFLNKGPAAALLFQNSISARGDYWRAAIRATKENLFTGVGVDNFGDAFLSYRDIVQVQGRGFGTFTNNAHNSFLQLSSTSGIIAALTILTLIGFIIARSIAKVFEAREEIDQIHIGLLSIFVSFIPVLLISIDNIGFTIWFWTLCGLLMAKSRKVEMIKQFPRRISKGNFKIVTVPVFASIFLSYIIFTTQVSAADAYVRDVFQSGSSFTSPTQLNQSFVDRPPFVDYEVKYILTFSSIAISKNWFQESEYFAQKAINLKPNSLDGWRLTALSQEAKGQYSKAIASRERIMKIDAYRLDNMLELSRNYLKLDQPDKALKVIMRMDEISPLDAFTRAAHEAYDEYKG